MKYKNISGKQTNRNREWTRMDANLGERDRPGRRVWRLAEHILVCFIPGGAGRETHPAATERSEQSKSGPLCGLVALPTVWISKYSRLFESIRGSVRNSLICRKGLTQVVDFHDICRYFQRLSRRPRKSLISMIVSDSSACLRANALWILDQRALLALASHGLRFYDESLHCSLPVCPWPSI
jgi:hypothetical protein